MAEHFSASSVGNMLYKQFQTYDTDPDTGIEFCQVIAVDTTLYTVTAHLFKSRVTRAGIPFCMPYYNLNHGILFLPEPGALGVAVHGSGNEPFIVSFINLPATDLNTGTYSAAPPNFGAYAQDPLFPGELLLQGSSLNSLKLNRYGDVTLSTSRYTSIRMEDLTGLLALCAETFQLDTPASVLKSGIKVDTALNPIQYGSDTAKYYVENMNSYYDYADNTILTSLDTTLPTQYPAVSVSYGNVFDNTNAPVSRNSQALCYRMQINVTTGINAGNALLYVDIDKQGNFYVNGSTANVYVQSANVYLGSGTQKAVARVGDSISVVVSGTTYTGTITSGSTNVNAS